MSLEIRVVESRKQLKQWADFPNKLYKNVEAYTPFLLVDEMDTFTKEKNPAYEFCETKLYSAFRDGKMVGRIAALINHAANKKWGTNAIRFTRFDFIDDYEVSKALFDKVVEWAKERGLTSAMGPIGFTDIDHEGMLVEGFDELNMSLTFYNYPYYLKHMENLGLKKDIDWVEFQIKVPEKVDERHKKLSDYIMRKNGYTLVTYKDKKTIDKDAREVFKVIDEAFSVLYGTVPLTDAVVDKVLKDYIPILNLKYVCSIRDKDGAIVGFGLMIPSIVKATKKSNGRLFPFGLFRVLKALNGKNDTLEMYFVAVKPEHQKQGVPAILLNHLTQVCIENGVKICETGPELETNLSVQSMWKGQDARNHRRRRCFKKEI